MPTVITFGAVVLLAIVSCSNAGRTPAQRSVSAHDSESTQVPGARDEVATDVLVSGGLTAEDIGVINALVRREDQHRIISILWRGDRVEVSTGVSCDPQCIAGNLFFVRKTDERWEIVERSAWKS
jgi:hypothetical protein